MLSLPADLREAIERALASVSAARWVREAQALSERYRAPRAGEQPALASGAAQSLGYAAMILPATYAQLHGAIGAAAARVTGRTMRREAGGWIAAGGGPCGYIVPGSSAEGP